MPKYKLISLLSLLSFHIACTSPVNKDQAKDTVPVPQLSAPSENKPNTAVASDYEEVTPKLEDILHDYLQLYTDTLKIDTAFIGRDIIEVKLLHYCTHDSSLVIHDRYTEIYGMKHFVTHSFETAFRMVVNDKPLLDTIIRKQMLDRGLPPELKEYAVLFSPRLRFEDSVGIVLEYSVSIPLTDVGWGVNLAIRKNGKMRVVE